ncbi:hypothetical protein [Listeria booriae]|uniref:Uncharacterized protein n=1 Tax=Listeria booriae TaxID=1552123 RepID=A0A842F4F5_9LIST|nr:hypothetical protein [Listeria booriae]MBC2242225.1 hypothetical protein [Listeria booriae]
MIIKIFLVFFIACSCVAVLFIAYNALLDRRTKKLAWIKFSMILLLTLIVTGVCIGVALWLIELPIVRWIAGVVDMIFFSFFHYLPKWALCIWFVLPLLCAWFFYFIRTLFYVAKSRLKYRKWKSRQLEQEEQENKTDLAKDDKASIHFLGTTLTLTKIKYNSILGLQRTYEIAKKQGLQISETETGYAAIFSNSEGLQELQAIFSQNSLPNDVVPNRPSLVLFDAKEVHCTTIKDAITKLSRGDTIG